MDQMTVVVHRWAAALEGPLPQLASNSPGSASHTIASRILGDASAVIRTILKAPSEKLRRLSPNYSRTKPGSSSGQNGRVALLPAKRVTAAARLADHID
jgi:hypothetical protein